MRLNALAVAALALGVTALAYAECAAASHRKTVHAATFKSAVPDTAVIEEALRTASSAFKRKTHDQFASDPVFSIKPGEPFTVTIDPQPNGEGPSWSYDNGKLIYSTSFMQKPGSSIWTLLAIRAATSVRGEYTGSNAYGATRSVSVIRGRIDAIDMISRPGEDGSSLYPEYRTELTLSGPEAKAMVHQVAFVVEGEVTDGGGNSVADCGTQSYGPTLDSPTDALVEVCWLTVNVRRVAYVNSITGAVLKEWVAR